MSKNTRSRPKKKPASIAITISIRTLNNEHNKQFTFSDETNNAFPESKCRWSMDLELLCPVA